MSFSNMKTKEKIILGVLAIIAVAGMFLPLGGTQKETIREIMNAGASPVGSTFLSAKLAAGTVSTATTTTISLYNSDASDRVIRSAEISLTGETNSTTTNYTIKCATSSIATGMLTSPNYIVNQNINTVSGGLGMFGTSTGGNLLYVASSSPGLTGYASTSLLGFGINQYARIWAAATYLNCTVTTSSGSNSNLFGAGMTGVIAFPYLGQ